MNVDMVREFLGWCTVINFGLLVFSTVLLLACRDAVTKIHGRMFGLEEATVRESYIRLLAQYKIAVVTFNFVPYLALRIVAG